jgi:restriction endonuclease
VSTVPHQIDVVIEADGQTKRTLIEAKDFDRKGKRASLGTVRDFRSVVEDIQPDQAFVVTCTGYTAPARAYAKAKGIKLAVLRAFEQSDWEGYIRRVGVHLHAEPAPRITEMSLELDPAQHTVLLAEMQAATIGMNIGRGALARFSSTDPLFFVNNSERLQICEFLHRELAARSQQPSIQIDVDPNQWRIEINDKPLRFKTFSVSAVTNPPFTTEFEVTSNRIAELILKGFGDQDVIVFADQLAGATFGRC